MGGLGDPPSQLCLPPPRPCPPHKFPETNRETIAYCSQTITIVKNPPISQPPRENPGNRGENKRKTILSKSCAVAKDFEIDYSVII